MSRRVNEAVAPGEDHGPSSVCDPHSKTPYLYTCSKKTTRITNYRIPTTEPDFTNKLVALFHNLRLLMREMRMREPPLFIDFYSEPALLLDGRMT